MKNRRKFNLEFKHEAVERVRRSGRSASQIAREPGISQTSLSRRLKQSQGCGNPLVSFSVQEANRKLRKENERLRMEREILKKATAFCARERS